MPSLWQLDQHPLRFVLLALLLAVLVGLMVTVLAAAGPGGLVPTALAVVAIRRPFGWLWG